MGDKRGDKRFQLSSVSTCPVCRLSAPSLLHWNIRWTLSVHPLHLRSCDCLHTFTFDLDWISSFFQFVLLFCVSVQTSAVQLYSIFHIVPFSESLLSSWSLRWLSRMQWSSGGPQVFRKAANFSCSFILIIYASQLHNALPRHGSWLQQPFP